jgi:hypothetical protein
MLFLILSESAMLLLMMNSINFLMVGYRYCSENLHLQMMSPEVLNNDYPLAISNIDHHNPHMLRRV